MKAEERRSALSDIRRERIQLHRSDAMVDAVVHADERLVRCEPLAEHEHRDHIGARLRHDERRVDRLGARTRQLLDVRRQMVQLDVHRHFDAALSEAEVAQCVQRKASLLAPEPALTLHESCAQQPAV